MKQIYLSRFIWLVMVLSLIFVSPAFAGWLTFEGIQKDDINDPGLCDWIAGAALSPDNRYVYGAGYGRSSIIVFNRDPDTGRLHFVERLGKGSGAEEGMAGMLMTVVSPDGKHVYAIAYWEASVNVFARDLRTGKLSFVECKKDGRDGVAGLERPRSMAMSTDGKNIYVAGNNDNTLVVLERDSQSGKLTFIQLIKKGTDHIDSLVGATCVVVSPDNRQVYATGYIDGTLTVFNRNLDRGTLSLLEVFKYNAKGMDSLEGAIHTALSPDGHFVYVAGFRANAVTVFKRDATTGKLTFVEAQKNGFKNIEGLCGIDSLALNPNGKYLYVSSDIESALSVYSRDANTGKLTFKKIYKNGKDGVQDLYSPRYLTISADSKHLYVSGKSNHFLLFNVRPK
jgi:6-phosphogluconolactonase (cycloisomerase 2 family)